MSFTIGRWTLVIHESIWDGLVSCIASDVYRDVGADCVVAGWTKSFVWPTLDHRTFGYNGSRAAAAISPAIERAKHFPSREQVELEVDDLHQVAIVFHGLGRLRRSHGADWRYRLATNARIKLAQAVQADVVTKLAQLDGDRFRLVL